MFANCRETGHHPSISVQFHYNSQTRTIHSCSWGTIQLISLELHTENLSPSESTSTLRGSQRRVKCLRRKPKQHHLDHDWSYLTQTPAWNMQSHQRLLGRGQQDCWPKSPGESCRKEAALEVPPSCVREPLFGVVAEDGPTIYGPWLLQQPPRTGSTWLKTEEIQR